MSRLNQPDPISGADGRRRSVLVVGAAGASGRSLAEQLRARGLRVHCADVRPMHIPSATCHLIAEGPGFLPALARLVRTEGIDLVVPASSDVLSTVSSGRAVLGPDIDLVIPAAGPAATAQDRLLTAWSLWAHGIGVPDFGIPSDLADRTIVCSLMKSPLILRARWVDDGRPPIVVDDPAGIDWASLSDDVLVQEFVPGAAYKVVVYRPAEGKGRLTAVLEETVLDDGEVIGACVIDTSTVPGVERLAQAAVRALGLTGPVEVSLRHRVGGDPVVLDVRACFGPHSHLVPGLLDALLRDHPCGERKFVGGRTPRPSTGGNGTRTGRAVLKGAGR